MPNTQISMPDGKLADAVLTPEEKQAAESGTDIQIILTVEDAAASVSAEDKKAVEAALGEFTTGQYLDISLLKIVGEVQNKISETAGTIRITMSVPDSLKNTDTGKNREFAVIRVHNGEAVVLKDLDADADTVTIETDRFSTYVLVYNDADAGSGQKKNSPKDDEPKTGDTTPLELYATVAMLAGFAYLHLYLTSGGRGTGKKTVVKWKEAYEKQRE